MSELLLTVRDMVRSVKKLSGEENFNVKVKWKIRGVKASTIDWKGGSRVVKNTVVLWKHKFRGDLCLMSQAFLEDKQRAKFGTVIGHQISLILHKLFGKNQSFR